MSLKSYIAPRIAERLLGEDRLNKKRIKFERKREKLGNDHFVDFFYDPNDPYSQLLSDLLPEFEAKYNIILKRWLVSPPEDSAVPERAKLGEYAKLDAVRLSNQAEYERRFKFEFKVQELPVPPTGQTEVGDAMRSTYGHYLGGTLYYGGEWYWGLDRLHYLEDRLMELGARKDGVSGHIYVPPIVPASKGNTRTELHWYLSFRSPYTAIVRDRVKELADAYGAELKLRFVLPMVMRGLPIPPTKKKYIPFDTAREARRLGVPFGRIMDPVGKPVEMGYSLLPWAREQGRGYDYVQNWLAGVWAEGIDVGNLKGLRKVVECAGLNWAEAKDIVGNEDWRAEAEANRVEMMERGIWGVPSFRVGDTITWGQDRLWVIEHALQKQVL